jgi:hypothetical protein
VIDMLDNVGIMDYRNTAGGPDGLIAHATDLLAYADRARRARIFVGVETSPAAGASTYWFLAAVPRQAFRDVIVGHTPGVDVLNRAPPAVVTDGDLVHLGVHLSDRPSAREAQQANARLLDLVRLFRLRPPADGGPRKGAVDALARDPEWSDPVASEIVDPRTRDRYPGARASKRLLPKLTFAGKSDEEMERELGNAETAFGAHPSYAGIAVHAYDTYRARFGKP